MLLNGLILLKEKLSEDLVIADTALNKYLTLETVVSLESFPICQISEEGERLYSVNFQNAVFAMSLCLEECMSDNQPGASASASIPAEFLIMLTFLHVIFCSN